MPTIGVIPAAEEQAHILANLLELYAHDFSDFLDIELGADGRFGYPHLPLYWTAPERHPFLITVEGRVAGFVLVHRIGTVWDMAEFFIIRRYRRLGVGKKATEEIWRRFPGSWEVRVMEANRHALQFWERAISAFVGQPVRSMRVEKDGKSWQVFSFQP